ILPGEPTESNVINNVTETQDNLTMERDINVTDSQAFDENTTDLYEDLLQMDDYTFQLLFVNSYEFAYDPLTISSNKDKTPAD
ncbi:16833_t:CDS:1, partial [Gigaspora margarita]